MTEQVKTNRMLLISLIPFGWLYVFKKVHKLRLGIGLTALFILVAEGSQYLLGFPYGIIIAVVLLGIIEIKIIKKICNEYNRSLLI